MKITQVMLAKGFGGAERLFVDLSLALAEAGQEVQVICSRDSASARILARHPRVKLQLVTVWGTWDVLAARKIRSFLQQHNSEVVQAHLARGAMLTGKACASLGLPLVVTTHNYVDTKYYRYVSMLVPPTRDQYNYYLDQGFPAERLKIINHFSPLQARDTGSRGKSRRLRLLALGRLVEKKGFHLLLRGFAEMVKKHGIECELQIGGTGPEQARLTRLIDDLDLQDRVTLVGWVDDVQKFFLQGDVFVLPSLDEPFGIVVIEAMAMGLAIVSSDCKGPKEILDDDIAWLFTNGDMVSLTSALCEACENHEQRQRKSTNAVERFRQAYSREAVIPEFIDLYASLLTAGTRPSPH